MDILNFLLSSTMVKLYLVAVVVFMLVKMAEDLKYDPNLPDQEPEDIEGHIAGINDAETADQAIEHYQQGNRYNALRSEAFIERMAQIHQDARKQPVS